MPRIEPRPPLASFPPVVLDRPATVVVADDNLVFRTGIVRAVRRAADLTLVGELEDGAQTLTAIAQLEPEVALVDVRMPGLDGLELCRRLGRQPERRTRVVLLSAQADEASVLEGLSAGAAMYLDKHTSRAAICRAIALTAYTDRLRR